MTRGAALLLAALMLLAGCLGSLDKDGAGTDTDDDQALNETGSSPFGNESDPNDQPSPHGANNTTRSTNRTPSEPRNQTPPEERPTPAKWPPLGEARIRPGVQIIAAGSQCTTNFVFRAADNSTLLIGTAAHCVANGESTNTNGCDKDNKPMKLGSEVEIRGATQPGILAYSSWETMQRVGETGDAACRYNDFALVAIHPDDRAAVHPAMLHFGGPTGLAPASDVSTLDKLLSYGNSGLRMGIEPTNWHEGYVIFAEKWTATAYVVTPIVPGDSGSAVLTGDGKAAGIAVTVAATPFAASNGITLVETALAYAAEHGGVDVELATYDLLNSGLLP